MTRPIQFYLPEVEDFRSFEAIDPDRDWHLLSAGRYQTVGQTYLRLKRAGLPVTATNTPQQGVVVVFAPNLKTFFASKPERSAMVVVCVQADRPVRELPLADVLVRHNGVFADGRRSFFIPNWVQGGLLPRDPSRGTDVRNVVYKGREEHLHPLFLSDRWQDAMASRDVSFRPETEGELRGDHTYAAGAMRWNDYRDVDVTLAVRPTISDPHAIKPAVKLVNSWVAGVPALLGPEYAYREQRRSRMDYLEIDSFDSALRAIDLLRNEPKRYSDMVENGRRRADAFSSVAIAAQWEHLLFGHLQRWSPGRLSVLARPSLAPIRRARGRARHMLMNARDEYRHSDGRNGDAR